MNSTTTISDNINALVDYGVTLEYTRLEEKVITVMENNNRDKKNNRTKIIFNVVMLMYFGLCGALMGGLLDTILPNEKVTIGEVLFAIFLLMLAFYFGIFVHMCLHETGHMICGLLSGYSFTSIRFGSLIIYRSESGIKIGRYSLSGTGGQCIMTPPDLPIEDIPTALYNWGGVVVNAIVTLMFGTLFLIIGNHPYIKFVSGIMVLIGLFMLFSNGIPVESMSNDGYNAITLDKDLKSKKSFVISFRMIGKLQSGISPKDFPKEWFDWSYDAGDGALATSLGVQRLSWLIVTRQFEEAYELGEYIDKNVTSLAITFQTVVKLERLFSMIMTDKDVEEIKDEYKKQQKNFRALGQLPSTQRALYAYHKLIDGDFDEAEKAKKMFDKLAKKYPYPAEVEVERELIQLVDNKSEKN